MTLKQLVKLIQETPARSQERTRLEALVVAAARDGGAVYYSDVGPTGAWNVFGDCYDYAEAHPDQEVG
jgi:allophanate hydrolase subunit 1